MVPAKILGIPPYRSCRVLHEALESGGLFQIRQEVPARIALGLREGDLQAALLSPVDFARDSSDYRILPGAAIAFLEGDSGIRLHFRTGARTIGTLAVDPSSSVEIVLARIILAEEFESAPSILPASGSLEQLLERADAALLVDGITQPASPGGDSLDVVEAWREMTDLPYVSGIWCCREDALEDADVAAIQRAHRDAEEGSVAAAAEGLGSLTYALTPRVEEGLRSFWHYAFYHGVLPDIPEVRFYSSEPDAEANPLPPSLN